MTALDTLHGTVVALDGKGVLLLGDSGSGKSDLALRLIDRGASLVADDRVVLKAEGGRLYASAPDRLAGLLEVRGLGIVPIGTIGPTPLALAVELVPWTEVPRLPERQSIGFDGCDIPLLKLNAFEMSTPIKIESALRHPDWIAAEGFKDKGD